MISRMERKLHQLEVSADRTSQKMKKMNQPSHDTEKVDLLIKEMQTTKNQMYYLQQALLQMRDEVKNHIVFVFLTNL